MAFENPKLLTDALATAAASYDTQAAGKSCDELIARARRDDQPFPLDQAKRALDSLRAQRMFALMERLADTFIQCGQSAPRIRRQYAQALLDQGRISSALFALERLVSDTARNDRGENAEARGLLGRAYKQMYVDGHCESRARGGKALNQAIRCYFEVYSKNPSRYLWHGVNAVALLRRAEDDGVKLRGLPKAKLLAEKVLLLAKKQDARTKPGDPNSRWNSATALEAAIGLGSEGEVRGWLERYLKSDGLTAFELGSLRRQLVEVWRLDPGSGFGKQVLPPLETKLLKCWGSQVEVRPEDVQERDQSSVRLEKVLGDTLYVPIGWYRKGLDRCGRVARVETEFDPDQGFGTGFLVRGSDLKASLKGEAYLVTNAHVVSASGVPNALTPAQARVSFKALAGAEQRRFKVTGVKWESPPDKLDCALLELDAPVDGLGEEYPVRNDPPLKGDSARVYIIGHPRGGTLSFSLNDNRLLDYDARLIHYRAPTEGGSSGSPVFNESWELVGLHHGGGKDMAKLNGEPGRYAANEGIRIDAIRQGIP